MLLLHKAKKWCVLLCAFYQGLHLRLQRQNFRDVASRTEVSDPSRTEEQHLTCDTTMNCVDLTVGKIKRNKQLPPGAWLLWFPNFSWREDSLRRIHALFWGPRVSVTKTGRNRVWNSLVSGDKPNLNTKLRLLQSTTQKLHHQVPSWSEHSSNLTLQPSKFLIIVGKGTCMQARFVSAAHFLSVAAGLTPWPFCTVAELVKTYTSGGRNPNFLLEQTETSEWHCCWSFQFALFVSTAVPWCILQFDRIKYGDSQLAWK